MKKAIALCCMAMLLLSTFSCKKSDSQSPQTALQKIQGTWLLVNTVDNNHYSGSDHIFTTPGTTSDVFDFRTDGKVYYSIGGYRDTVTYSTPTNTTILIDGTESYEIKTLTSNSFIIYQKAIVSGSDYDEETITWKK